MCYIEIILLYIVITRYVIKCWVVVCCCFVVVCCCLLFCCFSYKKTSFYFEFYGNEFRHFSRICYISCFIYKSYSINNIPTFRPLSEKPPRHPRRNIKNIPKNRPFMFLQNYLPLSHPIFIKKMRPFCDHRILSIMITYI